MQRKKACSWFWLLSAFYLVASPAVAQQRFSLDVPNQPRLRSSAVVNATGLSITDGQGQQFIYTRDRTLDSRDGRHLGYYSRAANRYLRWPAVGRGAMFIGERSGGALAWRESLMRVSPVGNVPVNPIGGRTALGALPARLGPSQLAILPLRGGQTAVGHIEGNGRLRLYSGRGDRWRPIKTSIQETFTPGASLLLQEDPRNQIPVIYTINGRGELVSITSGRQVRTVLPGAAPSTQGIKKTIPGAGGPTLLPNAPLELSPQALDNAIYTVDVAGRLRKISLSKGTATFVELDAHTFPPDAAMHAIANADKTTTIAIIDRAGNLRGYKSDLRGRWSSPTLLGRGFIPGGDVTGAVVQGVAGSVPHIASVDSLGRLHFLSQSGRNWRDEVATGISLPPGSDIHLVSQRGVLAASAVSADGRWRRWQRRSNVWTPEIISDGFLPAAPVAFDPLGLNGFTVDPTGRLVATYYATNQWRCAWCTPRFAYSPRLVSRGIVPNPPLAPANVEFVNRHKEALVVKVFDKRQPSRSTDIKIKPGESWKFRADRDAGSTLEETYLAPTALGQLAQEVHRYPLPPQYLYDVVVYSDRVTSLYFDRTKNKTSKPDSVQRSLVSLGAFPIPAGAQVRDGQRIDVYQEAKYQQNPGAAALFDQPRR